jgi:hypothetical protein
MKIGVIIPNRPDRMKFFNHCLLMLKNQTIQPDLILPISYEPLNDDCDITQRYRVGYNQTRNRGLDVVFLIENDDYYAPNYIETMVAAWNDAGRPELFGTTSTLYYNIKLFKYFIMGHNTRCSAMATMIKPDLNFNWPVDSEPYFDVHIWMVALKQNGMQLTRAQFTPDKTICFGIKHGVGKMGGKCHINRLEHYTGPRGFDDATHDWLKKNTDKESFNFYINYFHESKK